MFKKFLSPLSSLIGCTGFFLAAISSKGQYMYIFYGFAIAMLLMLIWGIASLVAEIRKPDKLQNRDS